MQKVGLVLSGGGALGAYEVGVWKALKKKHIKFDLVTGTSVGALNAIMVVQNDFKKCMHIWKNISFNNIYQDSIQENIKLKDLYKKYTKEFILNKGMDTTQLEKLLRKVYDAPKFYSSKIDYGIVSFNLTTLKPTLLKKIDIPPDQLIDYAIASAACFPAFKAKIINDQKYIDGGYYDNLPINLAIDMGAQKIIAVDLKALGIKRKPKNFSGEIVTIKPNNKLMNMLEFNSEKSIRAINLGYNDTLKKLNFLDGCKFTYKKNHLLKNYNKHINQYKKILDKFYLKKAKYNISEFIIKKYNKFFDAKKNIKEFNNVVEDCGNLFNLRDDKIYSIKKFNKLLISEFNKIEDVNIKLAMDLKKVNKKRIVKAIFLLLDNTNKTQIITLSNLFTNELFMAIYLKVIS